jgi:hypothetical protein
VFAGGARKLPHWDSDEVGKYLRPGTRAFVADDHVSDRAVFAALLLPIARGDISLGQHEMVEEVLRSICTSRWRNTSQACTTPLHSVVAPTRCSLGHHSYCGHRVAANPIGDMRKASPPLFCRDSGSPRPSWSGASHPERDVFADGVPGRTRRAIFSPVRSSADQWSVADDALTRGT